MNGITDEVCLNCKYPFWYEFHQEHCEDKDLSPEQDDEMKGK